MNRLWWGAQMVIFRARIKGPAGGLSAQEPICRSIEKKKMAKKSLLRWAHLHSPDTVQEPWRTGQDIGSHKWFSYHRRSLLFQENDQNVWDKKETCFEAPRIRRTCTTMESTKKQEVISAIIVVLIILSQCLEAYVNHEAMQFSIEKLPNCFL